MPKDTYYPLPSFFFKVVFTDNLDEDTSFQEVSGISSEIETESFSEGGENRFVYQLPTTIKHQKLILKRGITTSNSSLVQWCKSILKGDFREPIITRDLQVKLLNEEGDPVITWYFANAYPTKWEIDSFNSTKNEVAIETIELNYTYYSTDKIGESQTNTLPTFDSYAFNILKLLIKMGKDLV